ncbi:MAG: FtsX-like permease family protein [Candidatus Hodarchaeales archaeon]
MLGIINRIANILSVVYYFNKQNRKALLVTTIGLILSVSVILESTILVDNQKKLIIENLTNQEGLEDIVIISNYTNVDTVRIEFDSFQNSISYVFDLAKMSDYLKMQVWSSYTQMLVEIDTTTLYTRFLFNIISPNMSFFDNIHPYLKEGSQKPRFRSKDVIYLNFTRYNSYKERILNITLGKNIDLPNSTLKVTGILNIDSHDSELYHLLENYCPYLFNWNTTDEIIFLTYPDNILPILNEVPTYTTSGKDRATYNLILYGKILVDYSKFNIKGLLQEIDKLEVLVDHIDFAFRMIDHKFQVKSRLLDVLESKRALILQNTLSVIILGQPIVGITLYMIIYSLDIINKPKRILIGNLKIRGCSNFRIFMALLGEMTLSILIAIIGGVGFSLLLLGLVNRSSDLLEFNEPPNSPYFSIEVVIPITILTALIAVLINSISIFHSLRQKIMEIASPIDYSNPFWQRKYIDIILIFLGLFGGLILIDNLKATSSGDLYDPVFTQSLLILGVPSSILLFFGFLLFISRIFPLSIKILGRIMWKSSKGGLSGFTLKNVVRRQGVANKIIIMIFLSTTFTFIVATTVESTRKNLENSYFYTTGSDIQINTKSLSINDSLLTQLSMVSGVKSLTSCVVTRSVYYPYYYSFVFIDPSTFLSAAYYDSELYGLNRPVTKLMEAISDNHTLIISEENAQKIDDFSNNMVLPFKFKLNSTFSQTFNFTIAGTYKYWPQMSPIHPGREICAIGSLGLFYDLKDMDYFNPIEHRVLIDTETSTDQIVNKIRNMLPIENTIVSIDMLIKADQGIYLVLQSILPVLNSDFVICIGVVVIGLIMFGFHGYIERGKEIGIEIALGMTKKQIAYSYILEFIVILFFGLFYGVLSGYFIVEILLNLINVGSHIELPSVIYYPIDFFGFTFLITAFVGFVGMILPIYWSTKSDICRLLKVE